VADERIIVFMRGRKRPARAARDASIAAALGLATVVCGEMALEIRVRSGENPH